MLFEQRNPSLAVKAAVEKKKILAWKTEDRDSTSQKIKMLHMGKITLGS